MLCLTLFFEDMSGVKYLLKFASANNYATLYLNLISGFFFFASAISDMENAIHFHVTLDMASKMMPDKATRKSMLG